MKKKLLYISYYFPPTKSIACIRAFNICSEFVKKFEVHVFTTSNQARLRKDEYPDLKIQSLNQLCTLDPRTIISQKSLKSKLRVNSSFTFVYKILNSFPFNLLFGIGGLIYIIHGYFLAAKKVQKENITYLFSSYFPYSDHFICFLLKLRFPHLIWIADFRDLHYDPKGEELFWLKSQFLFNKKILQKANLVTTVSKGLQIQLKEICTNTIVVRNAIGQLNKEISPKIQKSEKFTIAYTGNIIPGKSNLEIIFQALSKMVTDRNIDSNSFQLKYVGSYYLEWLHFAEKYNVIEFVNSSDVVSLQESIEIQHASHINLLLSFNSPETKGILTGKFYEYLDTGSPILNIISGDFDSEFEEIFDSLKCGAIIYDKDPVAINKITGFINNQYIKWGNNDLHFEYDKTEFHEFGMAFQIEKIYQNLNI